MQQELKPLPVSNSDFATIINHNFLYVDKTKFVYDMIKVPSKYFLSRPRRFGKSTLLSTINEVFCGNKELFKDQWIYNSPWDWQEYPIIRLDFNIAINTDLIDYIKEKLRAIAIRYDIFNENDFNRMSYNLYFNEIVLRLYEKYNKQQVVILIDEYDKPILDVITDIEEAKAKRDILKGFYTVIKGLDEYVRFVFLTGVTRFSKVGIFSGLNNLRDITMSSNYDSVCGITQDELEFYLKDYIDILAAKQQLPPTECMLKIKDWYNGFCFCEDGVSVYNPYSTLLLFQENRFANYWFSSGNPSFLIKLLMKNKYYLPNLQNANVDPVFFDSFDIDEIELTVLLLQTGYLTIAPTTIPNPLKDKNIQRRIPLCIPNFEISMSLNAYILQHIYGNGVIPSKLNQQFIDSLLADNMNALKSVIISIFASIPNNWYTKNDIAHYEGFYCSLFYAFMVGCGYNITAEDSTNHGRIDLTLILQNKVYIFELKTTNSSNIYSIENTNNNTALEQIKARNYVQKYQGGHYDKIYLIGTEFSEEQRNLVDFAYEVIG